MAYSANPARTLVFKARRDTIFLLVSAVGVTFALSSSIHSRSIRSGAFPQQWTGGLADVTPIETPRTVDEPLTSASLVVPASDLALPAVPVRALVRLRGCDGSICPARAKSIAPVPVPRPATDIDVVAVHHDIIRPRPKANLVSRLNPLNHLPDIATLGRPFAVAGDTMSGWFRRF